jgi:hypothetical protein
LPIERNLQSKIQDSHIALPLAEFVISPRGMGPLQHVDQLARKQVRDDVVDCSEEPVCVSSTEQHIILAHVVQHIDFRFQ